MQVNRRRFFSRNAKYAGSCTEDLELNMKVYGSDVIRMELLNRTHSALVRTQLNRFLLLAGLTALYFACAIIINKEPASIMQARILCPGILSAIISGYILKRTLGFVQSERVFYTWDLALQTETVRTFGRASTLYIQCSNIHDIVINEVIEDLDVKYILLVRTKGSLFARRPIIPLFHSLSPSFECLEYIHRQLHDRWLNTKSDRSERTYSKAQTSSTES